MDIGGHIDMSWTQQIKASQTYKDIESNRRLQWMFVFIIVIFLISMSKFLQEKLTELSYTTHQQLNMLSRLEHTGKHPINEKQVARINEQFLQRMENVTPVTSISIAEANALTEVDSLIGKLLKRKRINLLGAEEIQSGQQIFWSVRINVSGQLAEHDLVNVLKNFDQTNQRLRITSLQYSPRTSNSLTLVIDFLYKRDSHE